MLLRTIDGVALMIDRERIGREANPSPGALDNRTVEAPGPVAK